MADRNASKVSRNSSDFPSRNSARLPSGEDRLAFDGWPHARGGGGGHDSSQDVLTESVEILPSQAESARFCDRLELHAGDRKLSFLARCELCFNLFDGWQATSQITGQLLNDSRLPVRNSDGLLQIAQGILDDDAIL
jgi:hypothetical protein